MIVGGIAVFLSNPLVLSLAGWEYTGNEMVAAVNGIVPSGLLGGGFIATMRAPTGLDWTVQSGLDVLPLLAAWILGLPFHVFGHQPFVVDNFLIWVGGWLIVASPMWFWLIKPRTRSRSIRVALRQRIAGVISKILHRFKSR
jgi:hypothetical protein